MSLKKQYRFVECTYERTKFMPVVPLERLQRIYVFSNIVDVLDSAHPVIICRWKIQANT